MRSTSNGNAAGSAEARRRRHRYLVEHYRANVDVERIERAGTTILLEVPLGEGEPACRCYRCGVLLTADMVTTDRRVPGCVKTARYPKGGTYVRENIRPACGPCNYSTGGALGASRRGSTTQPMKEHA